MQFSSVFFTLLAATAVVAKGNSTKTVSDKSLCKEMNKLEKLVNEAQNTTKLATKTKNNQTKIDDIVAKASKAAVTLDTLQSNTTLITTCAVINAADETKSTCKKMAEYQKIIDIAANTTKLADKTNGNSTKEAEFQAKATKAQTKLDALTSNTTLVTACTALEEAKTEAKAATASSTATASATSSTSTSTSGASGILNAKAGSVFSAIVVVAVGTFML